MAPYQYLNPADSAFNLAHDSTENLSIPVMLTDACHDWPNSCIACNVDVHDGYTYKMIIFPDITSTMQSDPVPQNSEPS